MLRGSAMVALVFVAGCNRATKPPVPPSESEVAAATPVPGAPSSRGAQPLPSETGDDCGASRLGSYIDALPSDDVLAKIKAEVGERPIRVIHPGDVVTMDFGPARLNAETAADGRIKSFRCG